MCSMAADIPAEVVKRLMIDLFSGMRKTGKPQSHEHTVLAGFAVALAGTDQLAAVALGTGTKCLSGSKRSSDGMLLHDSHAEVIARRALLLWIYGQLCLAWQEYASNQEAANDPLQESSPHVDQAAGTVPGDTKPPCSQTTAGPANKQQSHPSQDHKPAVAAFVWDPTVSRFCWRPELQLVMYVSQPPCGDACIYEAPVTIPAVSDGVHCHASTASVADTSQAVSAASPAGPSTVPGRTGAKLIKLMHTPDTAAAAAAAAAAAIEEAAGAPGSQPAPAADPDSCTQVTTKQQQANPIRQQQQHHHQQHAGHTQQQCVQQVAVPQSWEVEAGPQQLGALRRKPGRGEPTLSMSCSDKLARWACLGVQGALLSSLLAAPLYVQQVVVSAPPGQHPAAAGQAPSSLAGASAGEQLATAIAPQGQAPAAAAGQAAASPAAAAGLAAAGLADALRRALVDRALAAAVPATGAQHADAPVPVAPPPSVAVASAVDEALGLAPSSSRKSPSGFSILWSATGSLLLPAGGLPAPQAAPGPAAATAEGKQQGVGDADVQQALESDAGSGQASNMHLRQCAVGAGKHEVTLSAVGTKAGAAKSGTGRPSAKVIACCCSAALTDKFLALLDQLPQHLPIQQQVKAWRAVEEQAEGPGQPRLQQLKQHVAGDYLGLWQRLRQSAVFSAWLPKTVAHLQQQQQQ